MLSVKDFLLTSTFSEDKPAEVVGIFTHDGNEALLRDEMSAVPEDFVLIRTPDLLKHLFSCVPAYGGGEYLYRDKVEIRGKAEIAEGGRITLTNLQEFVLFRKGETFNVM